MDRYAVCGYVEAAGTRKDIVVSVGEVGVSKTPGLRVNALPSARSRPIRIGCSAGLGTGSAECCVFSSTLSPTRPRDLDSQAKRMRPTEPLSDGGQSSGRSGPSCATHGRVFGILGSAPLRGYRRRSAGGSAPACARLPASEGRQSSGAFFGLQGWPPRPATTRPRHMRRSRGAGPRRECPSDVL